MKFTRVLTTAILISAISMSCRVGNNVKTDQPSTDPDIWTGYYRTQGAFLEFCVNNFVTTETNCVQVPAGEIKQKVPAIVGNIMNNPTAFLLNNVESGEALIFDPFGNGSAFPLFFNTQNQQFSLLASNGNGAALWGFEDCTHTFTLSAEGQLTTTEPEEVSGLTTIGILGIDYVALDRFMGDTCTDAVKEMENCYFDHTTCGGADEEDNLALQNEVRSFYLDYIQNGAMTAEEISDIDALGFEAKYQ